MMASSFIILLINLSKVTAFTISNLEQIKFELTVSAFAISSLLFICFYNGKLGRSNKYTKILFYLFYPLHLLIFYVIRLVII